MAPPYDYWEKVLLPTIVEQCKLKPNQIDPTLLKYGYYPRGGGVAKVHVLPVESALRPLTLMFRGKLKKIQLFAFHTGAFSRQYANRIAVEALLILKARIASFVHETIIEHRDNAIGDGAGIFILATFENGRRLAGSALAKHTKHKAKHVGMEAAEDLYRSYNDGGCVDEWLQDQLIIYAALADGLSEIVTGSLTLHTNTAISIAEQMVGAEFEISKIDHLGNAATIVYSPDAYGKKGRIDGKHLIRCRGIGFRRNAPQS
jgi:RNA 3'-terminal phosphate cyclase (ATP)